MQPVCHFCGVAAYLYAQPHAQPGSKLLGQQILRAHVPPPVVVVVLRPCHREQYHLATPLNLCQVEIGINSHRVVGQFTPRRNDRLRRLLVGASHEQSG